jgi:hypothetical protein
MTTIDHKRAIDRLSFVKACASAVVKCEREGKRWSVPDIDLAGSVNVDHLPPRAFYSPHLDAAERIARRCAELMALHESAEPNLAEIEALTTDLRIAWGALTAPKKRRYRARPKVTP